mgnify:CR=1 FL=1
MEILLKKRITEKDLQAVYAHEVEELFSDKRTWNCYRYQERFSKVIELVQSCVPKKSKIIDVGTCQGNFAVRLANEGYITVGLDFEPNFLKYAQWKMKREKTGVMVNVNFVVGTASNLPVLSGSFDSVLFLETIEHLREPEKALHEIRRILRENGLLILSTVKGYGFIPNSQSLKEFRNKGHKKEVSGDTHFGEEHLFEPKEEELVNLLSSCSFEVLKLETIAPPHTIPHTVYKNFKLSQLFNQSISKGVHKVELILQRHHNSRKEETFY